MEDASGSVQAFLDPLKVGSEILLHSPVIAYDYNEKISHKFNYRGEYKTHNHRAACGHPSTFGPQQALAFVEPSLQIVP